MKIKTKDLTGLPLTFALAKAIGVPLDTSFTIKSTNCIERTDKPATFDGPAVFGPIDWELVGPLVEQFQIFLSPPHIVFATKIVDGKRESADKVYDGWTAKISARVAMKPSPIPGLPGLGGNYTSEGPTPLIAICRAVVACKLSEEVDVPDELGGAA